MTPLPLETAFDFLNTLELENGALVERLTSLDVAATWLAEHGVIHDPRQITVLRAPPVRHGRRAAASRPDAQRAPRRRPRGCPRGPAAGVGHRGGQPGARRPRADRARRLDGRGPDGPQPQSVTRSTTSWPGSPSRSSARSATATTGGSGSVPTTPVAGSSTTSPAPGSAAGATWRPAATGRRPRRHRARQKEEPGLGESGPIRFVAPADRVDQPGTTS